MVTQTRKARKGVHNRTDYFNEHGLNSEEEEFFLAVYRKALSTANKVVNHYIEECKIDKKEKINVTFGKSE